MTRARDRVIAVIAVVVIVALAGSVVALVLEAQRRGIETREDLRLEQIGSEANRIESLVQNAFATQSATIGAPGMFSMAPNDPGDAAKLQPENPEARAGQVLVDRNGTIVNGSLLRDESVIGTRFEREGLERALGGEPAILPVGEGLTTSGPTIITAIPVRDANGALAGAHLSEADIAPDSVLQVILSGPAQGDTISMSYVDDDGDVLASTDHSLLGDRLQHEAIADLEPGFHRGGGRVAAIAPVPSADWSLVFLQDTDAFEGDLTGPLQTALLIFLGVVGAVSVFVVVALLRRLAAAREEQRRLREIGEAREEFTSIVSHELRTPVAGLLGFLQTTIDHWDAMSEQDRRRAVQRAFTNARSLQLLTSDVLDSASIEAQTLTYRFEPMDLRGCVTEAVETLQDTATNRTVNLHAPGDPVTVRADSLRVRQVMSNLLDNAVKSSAPDSPIDVEIATRDGFATVSVRDRGPGIAPDEQARIFEKFTRGRSGVGRGTGLGLYISRHIVEAHGGTIEAESVPGEPGALLRFTLPLS